VGTQPLPGFADRQVSTGVRLMSIDLDSPRDGSIIRHGLDDEIAAMKKLAATNRAAGFEHAAREAESRAARAEDLKGKFQVQAALPLTSDSDFRTAVHDKFRPLVVAAFAPLIDNAENATPATKKGRHSIGVVGGGVTAEALKFKRDEFARLAADKITDFALVAMEAAYEEGKHQSLLTPAHYGMKAIDALRDPAD
jgi:hypothetical protein